MKYEFDAPSVHQLGKEGSLFIFSSFSKLFHFPHDSKSRRSEFFWPLASISCACSFQSKVWTSSLFWAEERKVSAHCICIRDGRIPPPSNIQYSQYKDYTPHISFPSGVYALALASISAPSLLLSFPCSPRGLPPSLPHKTAKEDQQLALGREKREKIEKCSPRHHRRLLLLLLLGEC